MRSFDAIEDPSTRGVLRLLCFKATHRAKYFCAGMLDIAKYGHYALNTPLYTHFTSPIRRYADIIVHRQLESVLQGSSACSYFIQPFSRFVHPSLGDNNSKFNMDRDAVAKVTQQCNMYVPWTSYSSHPHPDFPISKRDSAILAREQSAHLFLCVLISDLTSRYGPVIRQAKVIGVLEAAFDVSIPEFGIEKRVHVDQMPIDVWSFFFLFRRASLTVPNVRRTMFTTSTPTLSRYTGPIVTSLRGSQKTVMTSI